MPYLNLDLNFFEHPKTLRLIGIVGKGAESFPIRLWCYCGKYHARDGRLRGYTAREIESILGWQGEEGKLVDALIKVGFMVRKNSEYFINDWNEHEGHLSAFQRRAKLAARKRWSKFSKDATSNAKNESKQSPCLTNHTIPNLTNKKQRLLYISPENIKKLRVIFKDDIALKNHLVDTMKFTESEAVKAMGKEF